MRGAGRWTEPWAGGPVGWGSTPHRACAEQWVRLVCWSNSCSAACAPMGALLDGAFSGEGLRGRV